MLSSIWKHPLDWLYDSLSSPPVAGVWWAHWRRCPVAAVASSKWMLHTGGGWGETPPPPHMIVKRFGCTTIHNKALYKCIIHSFIQYTPSKRNTISEWVSDFSIGVSELRVLGLNIDLSILSDGMKFHFFWFGYRTPNCSPVLLRILCWPFDQISNDHELHLWSTPGGWWEIWNTRKGKCTFTLCKVQERWLS